MAQRNHGFKKRSARSAPDGWVLLAYRLPREPSTPRIAIWRKLRQVGAVQIVDGLVALPSDARTREQIMWLAEQIRQASGDAWIWDAAASSRAQEDDLVSTMSAEVAAEYAGIATQAAEAAGRDALQRGRALRRLRREMHRIEARDYFAVPAKQGALSALEKLAGVLDEAKR